MFIGFLTLFSIALRQYAKNRFALLTSPPLIVYVFLPGVALAVIEPFAVPWFRGHPRRARQFAWGCVGVAALACLLYMQWDYEAGTTQIHHALGRRSVLIAIFGMALIGGMIALQLGTNRAPRWLNNRATNWLGERSYAFYLLHVWVFFEIIHVVGHETDPVLLGAILFLVGFPIAVGAGGAVVEVHRAAMPRAAPAMGARACARERTRPTRCATPTPSPSPRRRRHEPRPIGCARRAPGRRACALRAVGAAAGRRPAPRRRAPRPRRAARRALLRAAEHRDPSARRRARAR